MASHVEYGGNYGQAIDATPFRRAPPHPLGHDAKFFPYSATTPLSQSHPSGLQMKVKLMNPHPGIPFRSGELIEGSVIISLSPTSFSNPSTSPSKSEKPLTINIKDLTISAYFESRTLFWEWIMAKPTNGLEKKIAKIATPASASRELKICHEVHRGLIPREDIQQSWSGGKMEIHLTPGEGEKSFPFRFKLPVRMRVNEWNDYPNAPRDLEAFERAPPPSFPDCINGSVQWIVEAILRLPSSTSASDSKIEVDERLFKLPSPTTLITRTVFPLLPADSHTQDLAFVPFFGPDLGVDLFGARVVREGKSMGREGEWRTWGKTLRLNVGKIRSGEATAIAELSLPKPTIFLRSASTLPLVLSLRLETPPSTSKGFLSKKPLKDVTITKAMISLKRQLSTRGGKDAISNSDSDVVRSLVASASSGDGSSSSKGGLIVMTNGNTVVWEIPFDLQSESKLDDGTGSASTKLNVKASTLTPSFRTPNIQAEYIISLTITIDGHGDFFIATFPIQLLAGESSDLPSFEEATGGEEGRDDSAAAPPAYGGA